MKTIKDYLLDLYLLPILPISICFCVIFIFCFIEDTADDLSKKRLKFVYKILNK